ncbi:MAG: HAD hydrolase family protein [Campylobacterales bacterium]
MIKLIVLDVDGTLTNGTIYYDEHGNQFRGFNVHDGLMMVAWKKLGGLSAIITGKVSSQVERRGKELGVDFIRQGVRNKAIVLEDIVEMSGLSWKEVAVIGDDFNDLPLFKLAGRTFAPANASPYILQQAHYRLKRRGGEGAVAEMIEILIKEQRRWEEFLALWQ